MAVRHAIHLPIERPEIPAMSILLNPFHIATPIV